MVMTVSLAFFILILSGYGVWFLFVICTASYNNIQNTGLQKMFYAFIIHFIHLFISILTIIISRPWAVSVPDSILDSQYGCHLLGRSFLINGSLHIFLLIVFGYVKVSISFNAAEINTAGAIEYMVYIGHAISCTLYLWTLIIFAKIMFVPTGSFTTDLGMRVCLKPESSIQFFRVVETSIFILATAMIYYLYTVVEVAVNDELHLHSTLKHDKRIIPYKCFLTIIVFIILFTSHKTVVRQMHVRARLYFLDILLLDAIINNILMYYCIYGRNIEYFASTDEENESQVSETFSISPPALLRRSPSLVIVNSGVVYDLPQPRMNVAPLVQINAPTEQDLNEVGYNSPSSSSDPSLFTTTSRIVLVAEPKVWICLPSAHPIKVTVSVVERNRLHHWIITDSQQIAQIERYANRGHVPSLRGHCSNTPELIYELQQMGVNQRSLIFME